MSTRLLIAATLSLACLGAYAQPVVHAARPGAHAHAAHRAWVHHKKHVQVARAASLHRHALHGRG